MKCEISVFGADLADGTPIYDVKPYVEYADSHPGVRSGFVDSSIWRGLQVELPESLSDRLDKDGREALKGLLAQDPRPQYQDDPDKIYGMAYDGLNVRFKVTGDILSVLDIEDMA